MSGTPLPARTPARDIDVIIGSSDLRNLEKQWFTERSIWDDLANKTVRTFDMTRQGFSLVAFGYTGPKAMGFKVRYIQEFDRMEVELKRVGS